MSIILLCPFFEGVKQEYGPMGPRVFKLLHPDIIGTEVVDALLFAAIGGFLLWCPQVGTEHGGHGDNPNLYLEQKAIQTPIFNIK